MSEYRASTRPDLIYSLPVAAGVKLWKGRLLAVNAAGFGVVAEDEPGLIVLGKIRDTVDNTDGMDGDKIVSYETGSFLYENSTSHPVTQAHFGKPVFIEDDITVSSSPGAGNCFAGFFSGYTNTQSMSGKVWVDTRPLPMIAAFFVANPDNNWRLSADPETGASLFQLWNQDQEAWQTVQLAGAAGLETLLIGAVA